MAKAHKAKSQRWSRDEITVSHRERLVEELRADPKLAEEYLIAAVQDGDPKVYRVASKTVGRR
jgi:hypothetical protein